MSNHKDVNPSEIAKRDDAVKNMATAIQNFVNLFKFPDVDKLHCISSDIPASAEVASDLLSVDKHGT